MCLRTRTKLLTVVHQAAFLEHAGTHDGTTFVHTHTHKHTEYTHKNTKAHAQERERARESSTEAVRAREKRRDG